MTIEMKPLGNSCNLACTYCYQFPMREAGNARASKGYDIDLMMKIADEDYPSNPEGGYTMFGGEALLIPIKDLEIFFSESHRKYGKASVQTNGSLITDRHIDLFKKYNVSVGLSIDGPNELNGLRVPISSKQDVHELTRRTMENIQKLREADLGIGVIITVHKLNGTKEHLPRLINFIDWLASIGIHGGNIHMMEVDSEEAKQYSLTEEENTYAFLTLAHHFATTESPCSWAPFSELENMQKNDDERANCVWKSCDPMNTQAVFGVEGNGQQSNCGMVNKEGIEWTKAEDPFTGHSQTNYMRDAVLYHTPPEYGGCQGCPFFLMCNGYCPGSADDGDFRNKTVFCGTLKELFAYYEEKVEKDGFIPTSKRADRKFLENKYIDSLINQNQRLGIRELEQAAMITIPVKEKS